MTYNVFGGTLNITQPTSVTATAAASRPAVTHQSSAQLPSLKQVATTPNDSNAVSCTVPVFAGNEAVPFPDIREWKMTGIPGCSGNGSPGMKTLDTVDVDLVKAFESVSHYRLLLKLKSYGVEVVSASSFNAFKGRLDKFWPNL